MLRRSGSLALCAVVLSAVAVGAQGAAAAPDRGASGVAPQHRQQRDHTAPGPVTGLAVTAVGPHLVRLAWTNPADPDLWRVMVRRSVGATPPGSAGQGRLLGTVGRGRTEFTDRSVRAGTAYSYAVFAVDRARNVSAPATVQASTGDGGAATGVAGQVTDTAGRPLAQVEVRVSTGDSTVAFGETDQAGRYTLTGLSPGSVVVCFRPVPRTVGHSPTGYLGQCYRNQPLDWFGAGTPVAVRAGAVTRHIDGALPPGGAIAGRLTDPAGAGLAGVTVGACCDGNPAGEPTTVTTRRDGSYRITSLAAGSYTLCFDPGGVTRPAPTGYLPECFDNQPDLSLATPVTVQGGRTTAGVDAALAVGGAVTGTVTDQAGTPVPGVFVSGASEATLLAPVQTDQAGRFALTGAAPGSYQVCFDGRSLQSAAAPYGYSQTCVGDFPGGGVLVRAAQATRLDGHVALAGALGGRVTAQDGSPLPGVGVVVLDRSGVGELATATDDAGNYLVPGLAPGVWTVCFDAAFSGLDFLDECYHDRTFAEGGSPVTVTGAALSRADESLAPAASVAGTLTGLAGAVLDNVRVTATAADGSSFDGWSGPDGAYVVRGLAPGTYTVCFDPENVPDAPPLGYARECFDDQPDDQSATPVQVALPGVTGLDASFAEAGGIAGTVTGAGGVPLAGVFVSASGLGSLAFGFAFTDADGSYRMTGLRAGDYVVCFDPGQVDPQPPTGYAPECFDNQPDSSTAATVHVTPGILTTDLDATLEAATGTGTDGTTDGTVDGTVDGTTVGSTDGTDGTDNGTTVGSTDGTTGTGTVDGTTANGSTDGTTEGTVDGTTVGGTDGTANGTSGTGTVDSTAAGTPGNGGAG